jgi:hypothetical protein
MRNDRPTLELEELNMKYPSGGRARYGYRARVPGGWLVFLYGWGQSLLTGATFYPDPDHRWDGGSER